MAALLRWLFSSTLGMKVVTTGCTDCGCDERRRAASAVCVSCVCQLCACARVRRCMEWWAGRGAASACWTSCARVWRNAAATLRVCESDCTALEDCTSLCGIWSLDRNSSVSELNPFNPCRGHSTLLISALQSPMGTYTLLFDRATPDPEMD